MPGPWLLLALALTLTLTGVPSGGAQPESVQQEAAEGPEHPGLDELLHQAERLLLLREDLQRLRGDQGEFSGEEQGVEGEIWRQRGGRDRGLAVLPFRSSEILCKGPSLSGQTFSRKTVIGAGVRLKEPFPRPLCARLCCLTSHPLLSWIRATTISCRNTDFDPVCVPEARQTGESGVAAGTQPCLGES